MSDAGASAEDNNGRALNRLEERFPFLRLLSKGFYGLALLMAAGGAWSLFVHYRSTHYVSDMGGLPVENSNPVPCETGVLLGAAYLGIVFVFLVLAELVKVLLAIEENTRRAAEGE